MNKCSCGVEIEKNKQMCFDCFRKEITSRIIQDNEIVFDADDRQKGFEAINFIGVNLYQEGFKFEIYYAQGQKSPHLHIKDIHYLDLEGEELVEYKKLFLKKYCPVEYLEFLDLQICNKNHLIAEENKPHYRYKTIKKLCGVFNELNENFADEDLIEQVKDKKPKRKIIEGSGVTARIVRSRSIIDIAKKYGLQVKGTKAVCPFHADSKPSLSFNDSKGFFNCFGCGEKGNIIDFIYLLRKNNLAELKNG